MTIKNIVEECLEVRKRVVKYKFLIPGLFLTNPTHFEEFEDEEEYYVLNLTKLFNYIIQQDHSLHITIEGRPRMGKTTLSIQLAKFFYLVRDGKYDLRKILYQQTITSLNIENIFKRLINMQREVVIFPEAIDFIYKREFGGIYNRFFIKFLTKLGRLNNVYIFNIPSFEQLDHDVRNYFRDLRFDVYQRGVAKVYMLDRDKWRFLGELEFPNLEGEEKEIFDKWDSEVKKSTFNEWVKNLSKEEEND